MKLQYKYIHFEPFSDQYGCFNTKHGDWLGIVEFDKSWKQHVFSPNGDAIFSASCLDDISHFLKQANAERTAKPQSESSNVKT